MAKGPSYSVPFRRRREGKTDYRLRKKMVISKMPRLVVRKTGRNFIVQLIRATVIGDIVITSAHSRELRNKYGWLGSLNNLPAAYLTGLLCGLRAATKGVEKAILDIGLHTPSKGAAIFAAMKGFVDAGVEVPYDEEILPDESRIRGEHIAEYAEMLASESMEKYSRFFSEYLARELQPQNLPEHFDAIKEKILADFKIEK
ncbi:MAG: 50S ribosomal protein L18 [Candidatus Bathyarchaeia archaeon]|nr:50S ribosomal protein L18 [Candidatus Bathyarchaeota archaeon]